MAEYIDRKRVIEIIKDWKTQEFENCIKEYNIAYDDALTAIEDLLDERPLADVKEVVRGKWIERINGHSDYCECDQCGYIPDSPLDETNFCPNCGAEMEVE